MRVCDVVINSIWYDPRVKKQLIEYKKCGFDVIAVGTHDERYDEERIKKLGVDCRFAVNSEKYIGKQRSVIKKIKRGIELNNKITDIIVEAKPDVIHANDLNALIPAFKAAKKLNCLLVYDSHEVYTENIMFLSQNKPWQPFYYYRLYYCFMEKRLVKKIDKMVCVSNAAADYFAKRYNIERPLVVTNCPFKPEKIDLSSAQKHSGFELLNHGQYYEGRGYDLMTKALPLIADQKEIKFCVRGFGKLEEEMRNEVGRCENAEQFIFYPPVTTEELIPEAEKSMAGVAITCPICLNFELSVSNKIFEYMAAGLPVIMSDIPEHRYLNEKFNFGIILSENTPECLAQAVKKLYTDKEFYAECAENSIFAAQQLCWETEFKKLTDYQISALNNKHK